MGFELLRRLSSSNYNLVNFDDRERSILLNEAMDELIMERYLSDSNIKRKGFEADVKRRLDLSGLITSHVVFNRKRIDALGNWIQGGGDFMVGNGSNGGLETPDLDEQGMSNGNQVESKYGIHVRIPDECLFIIADTCSTSKGEDKKRTVPVEVVTHEEYYAKIHNIYQNPYYNKVWRVDNGSYTPSGIIQGVETSTKFTGGVLTGFTGINADGSNLPININTYRSAILVPGKDWTVESYYIKYIKRPSRIRVDTITPGNQRNCELHPAIHTEIVDKAVYKAISSRLAEQSKFQVADKDVKENQ